MKKLSQQLLALFLTILFCTNCSYLQSYQQLQQKKQINSTLGTSKLVKVNEYSSRTPFHKTYEFEFNSSINHPYALIFYISESSFSNSVIKHRHHKDLRRDAIRIDDNKDLLSSLNNYLPDAKNIDWQHIDKHVPSDEARDSYQILQAFIRNKIRDL